MSRTFSISRYGLVLGAMLVLQAAAFAATKARADDTLGFEIRNCMTCHGSEGRGNPVVMAPGLNGAEPWYLRRQLENFRAGIRGGQPDYAPGYEMRAAARVLTDADIDAIVDALAQWRALPSAPQIVGDAARGRSLYAQCAACHGPQGQGIEALGSPSLAGQSDWYLLNQLKLFRSGYRGAHPDDPAGAQMRAMTRDLDMERDVYDVIAYISTLGPQPSSELAEAAEAQ